MPPKKVPDRAEFIRSYQELDSRAQAFATGCFNLWILVGDPGLQKSTVIRGAIPDGCWIEGNATAFAIYRELFRHRDDPILFNDVDGLCRDPAALRLMKSLCETERVKKVAWTSAASILDREGIPRCFATKSRVAIVANDWSTLNANVLALEDRAQVSLFAPSAVEVHLRTATWFWDQEIFDFVGENLHLITRPTMRDYLGAYERKKASKQGISLDWKGWLLNIWLPNEETRIVAQLLYDDSFRSESERREEFKKRTGRTSDQTYYNYRDKIIQKSLAPTKIVLNSNRPPEDEVVPLTLTDLLRQRHPRLGDG